MTSKCLRGFVAIALSFALCGMAAAQNPSIGYTPPPSGKFVNTKAIVAGIAGAGAAVVIIVILAIHYSKKRAITGCIRSGKDGLTVTDEGDKRTYLLTGNTTGLAPGNRVKLHGRKEKSNSADKTLEWDTERVSKDFGACKVAGS